MRPIYSESPTSASLQKKPPLWRTRSIIVFLGLLVLPWSGWGVSKPIVRVGSKSFTESYILGELIAHIIEQTGEARVEPHPGDIEEWTSGHHARVDTRGRSVERIGQGSCGIA